MRGYIVKVSQRMCGLVKLCQTLFTRYNPLSNWLYRINCVSVINLFSFQIHCNASDKADMRLKFSLFQTWLIV